MEIIELEERQFRNYSYIHSNRNIYQTVENAKRLESKYNQKLYLGLIDDQNNLLAATLLLISKLKGKYLYGYAPKGFLIDYNNEELLTTFTNKLKEYLKERKFVFIKLDPLIPYQIYNKEKKIIYQNKNIMPFLKRLGYNHLGFNNYFETHNSRYYVYLNTNKDSLEDTFKKVSRNVKRSIQNSLNMGITIHKGDINNLDLFYSLISKKTKLTKEDIQSYFNTYNNNQNSFEVYFAKIDPQIYVNNYRYLEREEFKKNNYLYQKIVESNNQNRKLINKKLVSDKVLQKYKKEIVNATNIYSKFPNGLIVGTCAIIKNNKEITFFIDGYEEKLREVHSSYFLKWEIIKKYMKEGYTLFNLGEISGNMNKENNKYYGLYFSKMGFNSKVVEYPGEFDLIINSPLYSIFYNIMHLRSKIQK